MHHIDIKRFLDLNAILSRKSCLLLGPRQTGKSWLIRQLFPDAPIYNLLRQADFRDLSRRPALVHEALRDKQRLVVIDEIQKLPELLDEVHLAIEEKGIRFLLTGSSARKLRRQGTNLLGGRARTINFHPLARIELKEKFDLNRALSIGLLPSIYFSPEPAEDLSDYIETYLKEEIAIETEIRNLPAFSRFLDVAALCNGRMINFTEIGSDAQVAPSTVREYFEVLESTLIAKRLPAWTESKKRKPISTSKFYFFDVGVVRFLQGRKSLDENSAEFGEAFETYIFHELRAFTSYLRNEPLNYWRSTAGHEVDFILGGHTAIEVKASTKVNERHLRNLKALEEERVFKNLLLISRDEREQQISGIQLMNYRAFLDRLWDGEFKE